MTDPKPDYMVTYDEFWKELVETDGVLDLDKVARELHDFRRMIHNVTLVYDHVTGSLLSKPNYDAHIVISAAESYIQGRIADALEDAGKEYFNE